MTNSLEPSSPFSGGEPGQPSWRWRMEDASGGRLEAPEGGAAATAPGFTSQGDAESWVGEVWPDLLEEGVEQVRLYEGDREVYGPMSLRPPAG